MKGKLFAFCVLLGAAALMQACAPGLGAEEKPRNIYNEEALRHLSRAIIFEEQGNYAGAILEYQDAIALDSTAAVFHRKMAENYLRLRKNRNAIESFEKYLTMEPRDVEVHHILAEIYKQMSDFPNAERIMERMRWIQSWPINFYYDLLQIYLINEKDRKAGQLSRELLRLSNGEENAEDRTANIKNIYQGTRRIPEGIALFEGLLSEDPENRLYRFGLGDLYLSMGDTVRAMTNLETAVGGDAKITQAEERLAEIYLARNEDEKALARFNDVGLEIQMRIAHRYFIGDADSIAIPLFQSIMVDNPDNFTPYFYLGIMSFQNSSFDDAERYLSRAVKLDSTQAVAYFYMGWTLLQKDKFGEARDNFAAAVSLEPKNKDFLYFLGVSQYQLKEYGSAGESVKQALNLSPDDIRCLSLYSDVLYSQGDFNAAEEMYLRVLEIDSTNISAMNNYSYMLAEQGVKLGTALELSKKAVEQRPDNQSYLDTLGWIYYRLGRYQEALHYLLKAVEADTTQSAIIYDHIGDTYQKLGDNERARQYWRKALELDKDNSAVRQKLEQEGNE